MEKAYYDDEGYRVIPSSPLETDILRQVNLADRFVDDTEFRPQVGLPIKQGGRLFCDRVDSTVDVYLPVHVGSDTRQGISSS